MVPIINKGGLLDVRKGDRVKVNADSHWVKPGWYEVRRVEFGHHERSAPHSMRVHVPKGYVHRGRSDPGPVDWWVEDACITHVNTLRQWGVNDLVRLSMGAQGRIDAFSKDGKLARIRLHTGGEIAVSVDSLTARESADV